MHWYFGKRIVGVALRLIGDLEKSSYPKSAWIGCSICVTLTDKVVKITDGRNGWCTISWLLILALFLHEIRWSAEQVQCVSLVKPISLFFYITFMVTFIEAQNLLSIYFIIFSFFGGEGDFPPYFLPNLFMANSNLNLQLSLTWQLPTSESKGQHMFSPNRMKPANLIFFELMHTERKCMSSQISTIG